MLTTQTALFSLQTELLWPFFHAESSKVSAHRDYARTRCQFQIDYLLHEVHPELQRWLPRLHGDEIPRWLGRADPQRSLDRVMAMLSHLGTLVSTEGPLHDPLYFGEQGERQNATSIALLALHAILYSHARWGAKYFHDVESAVAAEALLSRYPQWIRLCIVSLVLLKNVFRTSLSEQEWQRESCVWHAEKLSSTDEVLIPSLAALFASIWQPNRDGQHAEPQGLVPCWHPGLVQALSLVAQCYDTRTAAVLDPQKYNGLANSLSEQLTPSTANTSLKEGMLAVFEFGHYVFDEKTFPSRENFVNHFIADFRKQHGDPELPRLLWISLSRYWAMHHGSRIGQEACHPEADILVCIQEKAEQDKPMCLLKSGITTRFAFLDLDCEKKEDQARKRAAAYSVAFGVPSPEGDVWQFLACVFDRLRDARKGVWDQYDGMPWAYVTRALEILAHIYPDRFFTLRIERPQQLIEPSQFPRADPPKNLIALPREVPELDLEKIRKDNNWRCPKLLVARALAAFLINQRMTFGNSRQLVQVEQQGGSVPEDVIKAAAGWLALAQQIADKDSHKPLLSYLDVFGSLPVDPVQPPTLPRGRYGKYVLGIDIGGAGVKVACYELSGDPSAKAALIRLPVLSAGFPVAAGQKPCPQDGPSGQDPGSGKTRAQYEHLAAFLERLDCAVNEAGRGKVSWEDIKRNLATVGVTWPGAVGGELGHERVRAWSKILAEFKGYVRPPESEAHNEKFFWSANAQEIHQRFNVREAFATHFFRGVDPRHAPVTLMNDGDAHVLHALDRARSSAAPSAVPQDIVVLAAGAGTAMGAVDTATGRLLDLLAEAGKVIVDIGKPLTGKEDGYPNGTGGEMFSKVTLSNLAREVLTNWKVVEIPKKGPAKLTLEALGAVSPGHGTAETYAEWFTDPLFIGYLLEQDVSVKLNLEGAWSRTPSLEVCTAELGKVLIHPGRKPKDFAEVVAVRMGHNLADLVALTVELFGARVVYAAGGPMSGATGKTVLNAATHELSDSYGFHVVAEDSRVPGTPHRLARLLKLTPVPSEGDEFSGAHGAAVRAAQLLGQRG